MKLPRIFSLGRKEKPVSKGVDADANSLYPGKFFRNNDALMARINRLGVGEVTNITNMDE
jgi:hypothetical protein